MTYFCGPHLPNILSTKPDDTSPPTKALPIKDSDNKANPESNPALIASGKTGSQHLANWPAAFGHSVQPPPSTRQCLYNSELTHAEKNQSLTLIGLFMGSTVGISYLRFGLMVFPSTSSSVPTLLSTDALSSLNSTPPHLQSYLGHLLSFTMCNLLESHQFSWATSSIPTGILKPNQPVVFGKSRL